jgi:hypothetical protein
MDDIKIYDDFLNTLEMRLLEKILYSNNWSYNQCSVTGNGLSANKFWYMEFMNNETILNFIQKKIEDTIQENIKIVKLYANGQTFGSNGSYHRDDEINSSIYNSGKLYTLCIYFNDIKKQLLQYAGGDLQIKIPDKKFSISIEPLNGRGVIFPSNYLHKGNAFDRNFLDLRISLACKFLLI